jgi:RsmE family RNA methyltransferase
LNLILFEPLETQQPLARADPRASHILNVLRRKIGDTCDVGMINGPRGKAQLLEVSDTALRLAFTWSLPPPPLDAIRLLVGLPRPQTARKILQDASTLGVAEICFLQTERSDPSYAQSTLWSSGEWRRHLITGAEQAFPTQLPSVRWDQTFLQAVTENLSERRVALDNYEASTPLLTYSLSGDTKKNPNASLALAIGGERGWTNPEREALRAHGFTLAHLGDRVLRTETAVVAGLAILKAAFGRL